MTSKKKLKSKIRARMEKTGESYQAASRRIECTEKAVAIYHVVYKHEGFDEAAQALFNLVTHSQKQWPGKRRVLFVDIESHRNSEGGFDHDMYELLREYILGFLGRYLSEIHTPLYHVPEKEQANDIPDQLEIQARGIGGDNEQENA